METWLSCVIGIIGFILFSVIPIIAIYISGNSED